MISGRGGDPKLPEYFILDTTDGSYYPGGTGISEYDVKKLCDWLNKNDKSHEIRS